MTSPRHLIIIGTKGMGLNALEVAHRIGGAWLPVGFADDTPGMKGRSVGGLTVLGTTDEILGQPPSGERWFHCAVGNNQGRKVLAAKFEAAGWHPALLAHPTAVIAASAEIGAGSYVGPLAVVGPEAKVGRHVLINIHASVGHHSTCGDFGQICPGARIGGNARLGEGAFVGANAVLAPGATAGAWATVGASSFLVQAVPDGATALGVPARVLPLRPGDEFYIVNETKLKACFSESLGLPPDQVTDTLAYNSVKQWDSVAHMALVAALETQFNIMFDTDEIIALRSVAVARGILTKHGIVFP